MSKYFVCTSPDFDHEVIDVIAVIEGEECWVKGFDDVEWKEASEFARKVADRLGLPLIEDLEFPADYDPEE